MELKSSIPELNRFLKQAFPQVGDDFTVEDISPMQSRIRMHIGARHLRPGGTVSGPSIFALADVGVYLTLMAMLGEKALAVTTNGAVDFLRKPLAGRDLLVQTKLLKLGKVLVVGEVLIFSEGQENPVARANMTYSIPPDKSKSAT